MTFKTDIKRINTLFFQKSSKYGLPPMMPQHKKEAMLQALEGNIVKGYKRRKLKMNPGAAENNELELSTADMEIDDGESELCSYIYIGSSVNIQIQFTCSR
jgi:hypothetical protein